ncbi:MAG: hypothetical protein HDS35_01625 [Bacteroides sp.]|nr:hypothetical protein [Bacteroides sp.]
MSLVIIHDIKDKTVGGMCDVCLVGGLYDEQIPEVARIAVKGIRIHLHKFCEGCVGILFNSLVYGNESWIWCVTCTRHHHHNQHGDNGG